MTQDLNTGNPITTKKIWAKPEIYILDTDNVNLKSHPNVHENTGQQYGENFYSKSISFYFLGTIKQAIS